MDERSYLPHLPPEILMRILHYLFLKTEILVKLEPPGEAGELPAFRMQNVPMHAQILRVCGRLYPISRHALYSNNSFDCSEREGLKLLLQSIGPKNFSFIRHIVVDWDQLQDLAWSLAKEDHNAAMSGLEVVEVASWRTRLLGGTSSIYRDGKNYERQLCQCALDICEKHSRLNVVAQRPFSRSSHADGSGRTASYSRVKWRFVTSENDLWPDEVILPIREEFNHLNAAMEGEAGGQGALEIIDPF